MNKKFFWIMILVSVLAILLIADVSGLGLTPARKSIDFEENLKGEYSFKIINSEKIDRNLNIEVRGELEKYVKVDDKEISIASDDEETTIGYSINLPKTLTPGTHKAEIVVIETPREVESEDSVVGATLSVVHQIYVYVPYPGKYIDAKVNIVGAPRDGDVSFVMPVVNLGKFDIVSLKANIDIYNDKDYKIATFNTEPIGLESGGKIDIVSKWKASVVVGTYRAVISLIYDSEIKQLESNFMVGQEKLDLQEINVNNFKLGDIAKFEMLIENIWNEKITGIYSQMKIYDEAGDLMSDFNSANYDFESTTKKVLVSYWDTGGVKEGTYDAKVILHYEGSETIDKDLELVVNKDNIQILGLGYVISNGGGVFGGSGLVFILVILVIVLVLVNILWFLVFRKKMNKDEK